MKASESARAITAARTIASSLGLTADEAIVLHDSNKLALRLLPCDVMARVAPVHEQIAAFEIDLAQRLTAAGSPVAALEPRVEPRAYEHDDFVVTLWPYYEPVPPQGISPADYARALAALHAGMRGIDVPVPHCTDRVDEARTLIADRDRSPALTDTDREMLGGTLRDLRGLVEGRGRLLHGEPHPGNVLATEDGPLFIDLETCCRGPVEFDLAHGPEEAGEHYPGVDRELLRDCRILVHAIATAWRWDRADRFPDGARLGVEWLDALRARIAGRGEV